MRPSLSLLISLDLVNPLCNFPQKTAFSGALVYTATLVRMCSWELCCVHASAADCFYMIKQHEQGWMKIWRG